jgi:hypothetical protein
MAESCTVQVRQQLLSDFQLSTTTFRSSAELMGAQASSIANMKATWTLQNAYRQPPHEGSQTLSLRINALIGDA